MELTLYGTGSSEGFPAAFCNYSFCSSARKSNKGEYRKRTCSCIDDSIMIDFGPDAFAQAQDGLPLANIEHLIVTHSHADHFAPMDLHYLAEPFALTQNRSFHIYGNAAVLEKYALQHGENERLNNIVHLHQLQASVPIHIHNYIITPVPTFHDAKEECFLFIIEKEDTSILYAHDSACFSAQTLESMRGNHFSLVVMDCTSLQVGGYFKNHMGLPDNKAMQEKMISIGCITAQTPIVVTHFAHTFNPSRENAQAQAAAYGYIAAYDGIVLTV